MYILRGFGLRDNLQRILQRFWGNQGVVPKSVKLFGRPFGMERGVYQGGTCIPDYFQHHGGCSGKGGPVVSLWASGGISGDGLGSGLT